METFAEWLAAEMAAHDVGVRELATASGLSPATVSNLRKGITGPTLDSVKALARGLGIPESVVAERAGLRLPVGSLPATLREIVHLVADWPEEHLSLLKGIAQTLGDELRSRPIGRR